MAVRSKVWLQSKIARDVNGAGKKRVRGTTYSTYQYLKDIIDSYGISDGRSIELTNGTELWRLYVADDGDLSVQQYSGGVWEEIGSFNSL